MTQEVFAKVAEVFEAARNCAPADRPLLLDQACGDQTALRAEVEALLRQHEDDHGPIRESGGPALLLDALSQAAAAGAEQGSAADLDAGPDPHPGALPASIGRYAIVCKLGEGGMGTVYKARQENPRRTVALKVIRPGAASPKLLKRFEVEAHALGRLQHVGIAQIFEAGTAETDGPGAPARPFFAMEFIEGEPLTRHADVHGLTTNQRLALFARICDAVQHAHQQGVIHRDLKPGNILVDHSGQPKVLDFGVARVTDSDVAVTTLHTDVGQLIGTMPYMSPEQVSGDPLALDTRSDVYALGVIVYKLLTGRLPYALEHRSIPEAARVIRDAEPTRLSSVSTAFRGDIETIVAKALEKDKERRYASVAELGADVRRYLSNQPITARPASTFYQFRKFAKRNKAAVVGAVAVVVVLVAGIVATTAGMVRALRAEALAGDRLDAAEAARREAEAVNQFLEDMLTQADPARTEGRELTVREVLDEAAGRIDQIAEGYPEVEAAIQRTIGRTYSAIGYDDEAMGHLRSALSIRRAALGERHVQTLRSTFDLSASLMKANELDEAERLLRASIPLLRAGGPDEPELLARQLDVLAQVLLRSARYDEAEACFREAVDLFRDQVGNEAEGPMARSLAGLASVLSKTGDLQAAEVVLREALDIARRVYGERSAHVAGLLNQLAVLLKANGNWIEAEPLYREALSIQRSTHGAEHPATAGTMVNLAALLVETGAHGEAEPLLREAIEVIRARRGESSFQLAIALGKLSEALGAAGRTDEAQRLSRDSLAMLRAELGDDHPYIGTAWANLGRMLKAANQLQAARDAFLDALAIYRKSLGDEHRWVGIVLVQLGETLQRMGEYAGGEASFSEAAVILERTGGDQDADLADCLAAWAALEHDRGNHTQAEELEQRAAQH